MQNLFPLDGGKIEPAPYHDTGMGIQEWSLVRHARD